MGTGQEAGAGPGELRVASVNWQYGGLSETGDDTRWQATMELLAAWDPHIVLCQEMTAAPTRLQAHMWRTANGLGMTPVLGPPAPESFSGNRTAILTATRAGLDILDAGPPPASGTPPPWCQALLQVPGLPGLLAVYSVHLPPRSWVTQAAAAGRLASLIAQAGQHAIAGGDWNCYAPADQVAPAALAALPAHLRPARTIPAPDGSLAARYDVHDTLTITGLADAAAITPPGRRDPAPLTPTGINGCARVDRYYITPSLVPCIASYRQQPTVGSDHHALLLTLSPAAAAAPPGPVP